MPQIPAPWRPLCPAADIPPGSTAAFASGDPATPGLFAVHHHRDGILIYRNACPHLGVPLDWAPGKFLSADGTRIVCAMHGAVFRIDSGLCLRGPCQGASLTRLPCAVIGGTVMVAEEPAWQ
jgi:nitrite reductase/ring-hydroxylating ferredoxin subunit